MTKNNALEYVSVRVILVRSHRRRVFGYKSEILNISSLVPNTKEEAEKFYDEVIAGMTKYGKQYKVKVY